jgi:hypothetical protein
MTIAHAFTLVLEAAFTAASFGMLWLSFWLRDRHQQHHDRRELQPLDEPASDLASPEQDFATVGP